MKDHTLLQAICRTNRVYGDKPNGLIVDYIGIRDNMREAMKLYGATGAYGSGKQSNYKPAWWTKSNK